MATDQGSTNPAPSNPESRSDGELRHVDEHHAQKNDDSSLVARLKMLQTPVFREGRDSDESNDVIESEFGVDHESSRRIDKDPASANETRDNMEVADIAQSPTTSDTNPETTLETPLRKRATPSQENVPDPKDPGKKEALNKVLDRGPNNLAKNPSAFTKSVHAVKPDRRPTQKIGIIGGKGVGKSYLFQSMVYRTCAQGRSGTLAYYLDRGGIRLNSSHVNVKEAEREEEAVRFIEEYCNWNRLSSTLYDDQRWYRLRLPYRTGFLGWNRCELELEFLDGSGEHFFELDFEILSDEHHALWKDAFLNVTTIVFCLPLWTAFPVIGLPVKDVKDRKDRLEGFYKVVANFRKLRDKYRIVRPVRSILALTMADDPRSALTQVRERWIQPYMQDAEHYLHRLRKGRGVARYLANARKVSESLHHCFDRNPDPRISGIPEKLEFNGGRTWLIPVSAINGDRLDSKQQHEVEPERPPVPVHVELPLLVALCDRENALM